MRKALLLLLLSGAAAAQAPKPASVPVPAEEKSPPSRALNLKLDGRAADYTREAVREETKGGDNLPGLGEGAMNLQSIPTPRSETVRSPFPVDSQR